MIKPEINEELLNLFEEKGLDVYTALLYTFAVEYDCISVLYERGVFKDDGDEHKYRIVLVEDDIDNIVGIKRIYKCRLPLFSNKKVSSYQQFYKSLVSNSNAKSFINRLKNTELGKTAYSTLQGKLDDFNVNKLLLATIQYYQETGTYGVSLDKYLNELAEGVYLSYQESANKML